MSRLDVTSSFVRKEKVVLYLLNTVREGREVVLPETPSSYWSKRGILQTGVTREDPGIPRGTGPRLIPGRLRSRRGSLTWEDWIYNLYKKDPPLYTYPEEREDPGLVSIM